jgi:hypothetical protein
MFRVTRFCVQPYVKVGDRLAADEAQRFNLRDDALNAAQRISRRFAGVAVYEVSGWPVQDLWDVPKLLASHGEVPKSAM